MSSSLVHQLFKLLPSPRDAGVRVFKLEVGPGSMCGEGFTQLNPSAHEDDVFWPLSPQQADHLAACGVPLSLAILLVEKEVPSLIMEVAIAYLHELVTKSQGVRDMLNRRTGKSACMLDQVAQHQLVGLHLNVVDLVRICKQSRGNTNEWLGMQDENRGWTRAVGSYEVWFDRPKSSLLKVVVGGMTLGMSALDLGGKQLTGGRLWAGSILLARWVLSLLEEKVFASDARVLEIGAGTGFAGIALAKTGVRTVLSEREPALLQLLQDNISTNGVEQQCRVLDLDWNSLQQPGRMRRLVHAQHFGLVIGADVVYEGEAHARLVANTVRHALPQGGLALLVNARRHRRGSDSLSALAAEIKKLDGTVKEHNIPVTGPLQETVCGDFEPDQVYTAQMITMPPLETAQCNTTLCGA